MRLVKPVNRGRFARSQVTSVFVIAFCITIQRHSLAIDAETFDSKLALAPSTSQPSLDEDCCYTFTQDPPILSHQTDAATALNSSLQRDDKSDMRLDPSAADISYGGDTFSENAHVQLAAIDTVSSRSLLFSGLTSSDPVSDLPTDAVKQPSEEDRIVDVLCAIPSMHDADDGKTFASRLPAAVSRASVADALANNNALPEASSVVIIGILAGIFLLLITSQIRQAS